MSVDLEDLLTAINEKIPDEGITLADLKRPTTEFMMRYFLKVVVELGVVDTTESALKRMGNPELYKDIIQYSTVYQIIKTIYPIPEHLKGFSIMSLLEPKPEDVRFVCYVDSYFDYYYQRTMQLIIPKTTEIEELENEREQLKKEKEALQTELNMIAVEHAKMKKDADKVEESLLLLSHQLNELKMSNIYTTDELKLMKEQKSSLQEIHNAKWKEAQEIAACAELCREKDELNTRLAQTQEELQEQRAILVELEQKKADKKEQLNFYEEAGLQERKFKESLATLKELLKALRHSANKITEFEVQVSVQKKQIAENEEKTKCCQQKKDEVARELRNFHAQTKKNVASQRKVLSSLKKQGEECKNKLRNAQTVHEQLKVKLRQLETFLQQEKSRRSTLELQYHQARDMIRKRFEVFRERMDKLLEKR